MALRRSLGMNVFDAALDRMIRVYEDGHTVVVSFSAGKDSGVCVELCILAATITNRLPVHVIMRDEEIMYPGTYEYAERIAARPEVDFHWVIANQPIINVFNRQNPYFWVFDPEVPREKWVRQPPPFAYTIPEKNILSLVTPERFPVAEGKYLIDVVGLRIDESMVRRAGLMSSKGYLTKANGVYRKARPIYDWTTGDVWRAVRDNKWDYNHAYDIMMRMGMKPHAMRIGPPTMNIWSVSALNMASRAWPRWFDRVSDRLPGIRTAAQFGLRAVTPLIRVGESWEQCFQRTCIDEAPAWIAERAIRVRDHMVHKHESHATTPLPQVTPCKCSLSLASWKRMAMTMYGGNPFSSRINDPRVLPYVEPEFFRPGAGTWGGSPTW